MKERYIEKMETAASSAKFDKAETPAAMAAAQKVRKLVADYTSLANKLL